MVLTKKRRHHKPHHRKTIKHSHVRNDTIPSVAELSKLIGKHVKIRTRDGKTRKLLVTGNVVERPDSKTMIVYRDWLRTRRPTLKKMEIEFDDGKQFYYESI